VETQAQTGIQPIKINKMKKFLFLIAILFSLTSYSQSVQTTYPTSGHTYYEFDPSHVRTAFTAILDQTAYAVVFSVDPIGTTKVLKGKNNNYWAGVAFPSGANSTLTYYSLTGILDGIAEGEHTLRVDVYGKNFRDLTDSREITFFIEY
jgi:hypothetical protein